MNYYTNTLGEASNSGLKAFRVSGLNYLEWVAGSGKNPSAAMRDGTAFHLALHKPDEFARKYFAIPNIPMNGHEKKQAFVDAVLGELLGVQYTVTKSDSAESLRDMVHTELAKYDIYILSQESLDTMRRMIDSLNRPWHSLAQSIVARGTKELELHWTDAATGINCKALLDSWDEEPGFMVESDLKRTVKITKQAMAWDACDRAYDHQRAWYRRALREHGKEPAAQFLVCGQPEPPYLWAVYSVPEARICYLYDQHTEELAQLRRCLDSGNWNTINDGDAVELQMRTE